MAIVKDIKERMCSVALDYSSQIKGYDNFTEEEKSYELPDERVIQINSKTRYRCTESLFNPALIGHSGFSLIEMMTDSLGRCDSELQSELLRNIVLGGGSSMFKGLLPRIQKEILKAMPRAQR